MSRNKIHTLALEEGERIGTWEEERRRAVFEQAQDIEDMSGEAKEILYIQVDGTAVNDRQSGQWMECKVGASFSERVPISKGRVWLMDKRSYASIEDVDAFGEKFFLDCVNQGALTAKKVFFIGDGARWIRSIKERYFPEAIGILDIWHLVREFKRALGEEREQLIESLKQHALQGETRQITDKLTAEASRSREMEERRKILEALHYVKANGDWIQNIPKAEGYGSGPVEKTVDITVARRFKKRGMSWYKKGANPLLKLRLLKLNGQWDAYWEERQNRVARYAA